MKRHWTWLGAAVALVAAFMTVLHLFPNEDECVASGRRVDPTRRHCEDAHGYVQLREHVLSHSKAPIVFAVVVGAIVYFIRRRRSAKIAQRAGTA